MENQRIRLSKKLLKEALLRLLQKKSIDKITIYELCGTAQINRTTFYKYYGNQYDLLGDIQGDFFSDLEKYLLEDPQAGDESMRKVMKYLESEQDTCKVLINSVPDREFSEKLFSLPAIRILIKNYTPDHYTPKQEEYFRLFFCQGGYAIIRKWLNDENREPPEEIADLITSLRTVFSRS